MIPNLQVGTARRAVRGRLGEATLPKADLRRVMNGLSLIRGNGLLNELTLLHCDRVDRTKETGNCRALPSI